MPSPFDSFDDVVNDINNKIFNSVTSNTFIYAVGSITGSFISGSFIGDGTEIEGVITSSYSISSSHADFAISASHALKADQTKESLSFGAGLLGDAFDGSTEIITSIDSGSFAGTGLGADGTGLIVNVDDTTIEIDSDNLRVKDGGISNTKLTNSSIYISGSGISNEGSVALGATASIDVQVDDSTIEISGNNLKVKPGGITTTEIADSLGNINENQFTGSFLGDGSGLTGIEADSVAFDDITGKPTLISSSIQIDHDQTTNFEADEHFTQADITEVGTVITGNVDAILPSNIVSSSIQIDHDQTTNFEADEHFLQEDITTVGTVTTGNVDAILPSNLISSSLQFNNLTSPFTGSFTGSFVGDGSGLTGIGSVTSIETTEPLTGGTITETGTIGITQATTSTDGYLSSTDWNTFNDKTICTGTVTSVTSGDTDTITIGGTSTDPTVAANTAAILDGGTNLATGDQIYDHVTTRINGLTDCIGTVTSVGGTGTVAGITLSGTVTDSGNLTLGGTFSTTTSSISDFNTGVGTIIDGCGFTTGTGTVTGTGVNNQIATWNSTSDLDGSSNLTFDGNNLYVGGTLEISSNNTSNNLKLTSTDTTTAGAPDLVLFADAAAQDGDTLGTLLFQGKNGMVPSSTSPLSYAGFFAHMADTSSNHSVLALTMHKGNGVGAQNTAMNFSLIGADNSAEGALYINPPSGYDFPTHNLDVNGTGRFTDTLTIQGDTTINGDLFVGEDNNSLQGVSVNGVEVISVTSDGIQPTSIEMGEVNTFNIPVHLMQNDSTRITLHTNTNIGINQTSPSYKLDVDGTGRFTGVLALNEGTYVSNNKKIAFSSYNQFDYYIGSDSTKDALHIGYGSTIGTNAQISLIQATDRVGINQTNPSYSLDVAGTGRFTGHLTADADLTVMNNSVIAGSLTVGQTSALSSTVGRIDATNDIVAFSSSDKRWKTNIININDPIEKINKINGVSFDWIEDSPVHGNKGHDIGVIAQEVEAILPQIVNTRSSGMKAVRYEKLIPLLIEGIKDLQKQINDLKKIN